MSGKSVQVLVVAGANMGKTTIAHIIKEALDAHGFAEVTLEDLPPSSVSKLPIQQRIETTKKRPIKVSVRQFPAPPSAVLEQVRMALSNARSQIQTLGSETDDINRAHLKELDEAIHSLAPFVPSP